MRLYCILAGALLYGCTSQGNWKHSQVRGAEPKFCSHRLIYSPSLSLHPMELEIVRQTNTLKGYLIVKQKPFLPYEGNTRHAVISVEIEGETVSYLVSRYKEGYRLRLPESLMQTIISTLSEGKPVTIQTSHHTTCLSPKQFLQHYKEFQKDSSLPTILQSPF